MKLLEIIKDLFARIFTSDPEEGRKRTELRRIHALLVDLRPPYYRPKQNLVLPGIAQALFHFYTLLRPLAELARATVANSDIRISQRYFDYLIDCRLSMDEQEKKRFFSYDGMSERLQQSFRTEEEFEAIAREFQGFIRSLDELGPRAVNADLYEVDRFLDICRYDYERILGLFDPSASLDDPRYRPDFAPVPGEQVLPELMDFYYLIEGFSFSAQLKENVIRLLERRQPGSADTSKRAKIDKLFSQLDKSLSGRFDPEILRALMRAIRGEPFFTPATPRERKDFLDSYRKRLVVQYEKDRERLLREQHETAIASDIQSLFGDADILEVEGYDDENDSFLRRESPNSFMWIKPLRILKTFIAAVFDPMLKESVKRILVEGYFDNKNFQNNLANILYQCERSPTRIVDFEEQLKGNGRVSIVSMKRYIEEMRRGKDIAAFLTRLTDSINARAREIVEDETAMFAMLGDALGDLLSDYRRSSPELVTNIRTLGGGRNKEILAQVQVGRDRISILVKIMRNFTFVKTPPPGALTAPSPGLGPVPAPEALQAVSPLRPDDAELGFPESVEDV
ncbi:MAG TPA: DUF5312 family protein [Rectinemataceae bacterium]|nr:DUF5312 family protein [Rectinemataceae bacterium]